VRHVPEIFEVREQIITASRHSFGTSPRRRSSMAWPQPQRGWLKHWGLNEELTTTAHLETTDRERNIATVNRVT
jgi:hypothetical protein